MTRKIETNSPANEEGNSTKHLDEGSPFTDGMPDDRLAKVMKMRQAILRDDFEHDRLSDVTINRVGRDLGIQ